MSQLCSICHGIPVILHTPGAYGQCSMFDHSGDKQPVVLGTRYGTWWPWYSQFEVGWSRPLQLWLSARISLVAPMLVSQGRDPMHSYIPLGLNQLLNVRVDQWLQICIVGTCQWVYILVEGLFCQLVHSFPSMPQWLGTQQKRTFVPLSRNNQSRFMISQIKGFSLSSSSIACKQDIESE